MTEQFKTICSLYKGQLYLLQESKKLKGPLPPFQQNMNSITTETEYLAPSECLHFTGRNSDYEG